jgi:hypothetical protein
MKNLKLLLVLLIGVVGLVSCLTQTPAKTPTLAISPGSATLTAGTGSAGFTATLTDSTSAISWAISPDLGSLSSTSGTSTTYSPPATVSSATAVTLTASSSGAASVTATINVNPGATVDTTAPTIVSVTPADGATGVVKDANIVVTFSEAMNQAATQLAFQSADLTPAVFSWNSPTELVVNPNVDLTYLATTNAGVAPKKYTFSLTNTATDLAGNKLSTTTSSFSTLKEVTNTLSSTDALTGDVRSNGAVGMDSVFGPGDSINNTGYQSFTSFDLSGLPPALTSATILSAALKVFAQTDTGTPYTNLTVCTGTGTQQVCESLVVESVGFGTTLDATAPNKIPFSAVKSFGCGSLVTTSCNPVAGLNTINALAALKADWDNRATLVRGSRSQYKFRFAKGSNGDGINDYINLTRTGTNGPKLEITYLFP